jgi:hypothetical protein
MLITNEQIQELISITKKNIVRLLLMLKEVMLVSSKIVIKSGIYYVTSHCAVECYNDFYSRSSLAVVPAPCSLSVRR